MSKPIPEKESRENLINWARKYGCEAGLYKIFARYDGYLKNCKSEEERKAIAAMGIGEIDAFFGGQKEFNIIK